MNDRPGGTTHDWIIYACRSPYAAEVAEIIWRRGEQILVLVDNLGEGEPELSSLGSVIRPGDVDPSTISPVVIPLLTPGHRHSVEREIRDRGPARFPVLVDPTSVVARTSTLGEGTVVNCAAVIGASSRLGRFVHVNRSASIGHDAVIHGFATLGPACVLAGHVTIQSGAFIGAGAVCAPGVTVGANSIVGAGAVVVNDVPAGAVVIGNPAKIVRISEHGYGRVSVPVPMS